MKRYNEHNAGDDSQLRTSDEHSLVGCCYFDIWVRACIMLPRHMTPRTQARRPEAAAAAAAAANSGKQEAEEMTGWLSAWLDLLWLCFAVALLCFGAAL